MNKKDIIFRFIKELEKRNLLTKFIANIFDYNNFHDYNYLFRIINDNNKTIIDIYDNISDNRFNRYIFDFEINNNETKVIEEGNVFITYINVLKQADSTNKLYKLAYLTKLDKHQIIKYASTFLNKELVDILADIIKK